MKKSCILFLSSLFVMVSCLQNELIAPESCDQDIFDAFIESPANTKVFLNEDNMVFWSECDQLAIFRSSTLPSKYQVSEESVGKNHGKFTLVDNGDNFYGGFEIAQNIAFYPYFKDVDLSGTVLTDDVNEYTLSGVEVPTIQKYAENSFANDSFLMVAVTETPKDKNLNFKNVLGALKIQLTGTQKVKSIRLQGANGEKISGPATVVAYADNHAPSIIMADDASTEVIIRCDEGVQLDEEEVTNFIFALPPVVFQNGFSLIVTDIDGMKYELSTAKVQSIERSTILRMPPIFLGEELLRPEKVAISIYEVGANYLDLAVQTNQPCEVAYVIATEQTDMTPVAIFESGTVVEVDETKILKILDGINYSTSYHLYAAAKLNAYEYSDVQHFEFTTPEMEFTELLTVVNTMYDGYKMRITLPESAKAAGNAIRWSQCCLMMYNYMGRGLDHFSLISNGKKWTTEDITLEYSEDDNRYVDDETGEWYNKYDPISPGEPVVFIAGEYSFVDQSYDGNFPNVEHYLYEIGPGYYIPVLDEDLFYPYYRGYSDDLLKFNGVELTKQSDVVWTGAFQRKFFRTREPELLDGSVDVILAEASPANLIFECYPDENVEQYCFLVLDDHSYNYFLELISGNKEYLKWAVTSYFSAYNFGANTLSGPVRLELTSFYYQDLILPDSNYHVLVTAMGDRQGKSQSFKEYVFKTTSKQLPAPEILVTPLNDYTTPDKAAFNIKCTTYQTNPIAQGYYAANYVRDWVLEVNNGNTYFNIIKGGNPFSPHELQQINSDEGLTIYIPSIDGESTRLAVLGYNEEYTPNDLNFQYIEDCPAVATIKTPYYSDYYEEDIPWISPREFEPFLGEWTATATLIDGSTGSRNEHTSKVTLANNLGNFPSTTPSEAYDIYMQVARMERDEVDALYAEFKELAEEYAQKRLANMNRILGTGWLDDDSYDRLILRTPYDLFIADDYSGVDIPSIFNDFGPKWYLEAGEDPQTNEVTFRIPVDQNLLPPAANWSVPFYMAALDPDTYQAFMAPEKFGDLYFPVEYDQNKDQITIKPFVYDGVKYYPNIIGFDSLGGSILENPVVSEIVLTRGWTDNTMTQFSVKTHGTNVPVRADLPTAVYKQRTALQASEPIQTIETPLLTVDQIKSRADEYVRMRLGEL